MANVSLKFMLGLYPKTEAIEKQNQDLLKEYKDLQEYSKSEELARYQFLDQFINSQEFTQRVQYYKNLIFKGSTEEQKEKEYTSLKHSKDVKFYYKFKNSDAYKQYLQLDGSSTINDYEHLKAFVESPQYKKVEEYMKDKKKFEKTKEFQRFTEYKSLAVNPSFINYFKFIGDKAYNDFKKLFKSSAVVEFEALEKYILSNEFTALKNSMKKKEFIKTEAYQKFHEYLKQKKSREIRNYYRLIKSEKLGDYRKLHDSDELKYFKELEAFAKSPDYAQKKREIEAQRFELTEEYRKMQEFKRQSAMPSIKGYYKLKASAELADFKRIDGSKLIPDYEAREKYIHSQEFKDKKVYLLDSKKWLKTEEYKQQQEYLQLKKTPKIIWYYKIKDSDKFDEIKRWSMVFDDDFDSGKIDKSKWLTRYFWGEVLLGDTYALPGEYHLFTENKNFEFNGSSLKIITKNEQIKGKEWNPAIGFYPRDFNFTSGIINTGSSFRMKFGKIEAKIKIDASKEVAHAFWLAGEKAVPQIDIFKYFNNKLTLNTFWGSPEKNENISSDSISLSASSFKDKYFIYTLEWLPGKLIWKINNQVIKTQTNHIPEEEMYVVLNSGVYSEQVNAVPAKLEIDWIRCYKQA
jgi:hypothetical protein